MTFSLSPRERIARMRSDLRTGLPVVIVGDRITLVMASELMTDVRFAALKAAGPMSLSLTKWRADGLGIAAYDGDLTRLRLPSDADPRWVRGMADPQLDFSVPMKGPFTALRDGNPLPASIGLRLCKQAHLLPSVVSVDVEDIPADLTAMTVADLLLELDRAPDFSAVSAARVPLGVSRDSRVHVFRPDDGAEEHYAIEIGSPNRDDPVLTRLHSACFTGDVIGSLKCDCGPQLRHALQTMGENGSGVLLYLNQEGRGIGLANKLRAYALQDLGFDTVEANHRLGFEDDERNFRIGADILKQLGFGAVRLMTNNPTKVDRLNACGIEVVERVPLKVGQTQDNTAYLATKAAKSGHLL
ncbi:MAG: GTP cyclohydrolase II [Pseudomonadota bacterium]